MIKKIFLMLLISSISFGTTFANGNDYLETYEVETHEAQTWQDLWRVSLSMGHTTYEHAYKNEGDTIAGRLALGVVPFQWETISFGLEVGIQSGNQMSMPEEETGDPSVQTTIKPMIDLLATVEISLNRGNNFIFFAKGGAVYRKWEFDRSEIGNISRINGEVQAGLGIKISAKTKLIAYYQGIFDGKVDFNYNETANSGSAHKIPTQHGGFLGVEIAI
jgi:hypothetical protein